MAPSNLWDWDLEIWGSTVHDFGATLSRMQLLQVQNSWSYSTDFISAHHSIHLFSTLFYLSSLTSLSDPAVWQLQVHRWFKLGCRQVCANFMARLTSIPSTLNFNWFSFQVCMDRQFIWYRLVNRPKLACGQNPLKNPWPGKKEIQARAASGVGQNGSLADDPSVVEFSVWTTGWLWQHSKRSI